MTLDWKSTKVVVTGGAGFLGSFVVEALQKRGAKEVIVPRSKDYDLVKGDDVRRLLADAKPDLVLHLAARVGGIGANRDNPGRFFYENAMMGIQLIHEAYQAGVKKLVAVGTVCAYPKFCPVPFKEDDIWNGYPEETNAPYGIAKKVMGVQSAGYREQYGFNSVVVYPVNLYGPRDNFDLHTSHVIPAMLRKFDAAKQAGAAEVVLWGDGSPTREFFYVEDCAEGLLARRRALRLERPGEPRLQRGDLDQGSGGEDFEAGRLRRPRRLGHRQAQRPAPPQARRLAREGALRLRSQGESRRGSCEDVRLDARAS